MSYRNMDPLAWAILIITVISAIVFALCNNVNAEGNVGFNYSRAIEDANWGAHGDYEKDFGAAAIDLEASLQSGDVYTGDAEAGLTFDTPIGFDAGPMGVRIYSSGLLKGYTLGTIGYDNRIGADLVIPVYQNTTVSVGIFGRTGNPFAPRTALGTLTDVGFEEDVFDGLGLEGIELDEGISIKPESSVNAAVKAEFDVSRFEIEVKGLLELAGKGAKAHQINTDISTGGSLIGGLNWRLNADIITQLYGDTVEYEIRNFLGLEYPF